MSGGSIEDNGTTDDATVLGGGVFIMSNGGASVIFNMTGGTITGNKANTAGGISLQEWRVKFIMNGGTIAGNQAVVDGGAVRVAWGSTFIMNDGVISGNTTDTSGGGISVIRAGSSFTMNGGTILGNTATQMGGGVSVDTTLGGAPSFTMQGGIIKENQARAYGGGVYVMTGGVFAKQPPASNGSSGVIYGYNATDPNSNKAEGSLGIEEDHGHAVYLSATQRRELTVGSEQHLDSAVTGAPGGWTE
jgi:hypothetical protein